MNDRDVWGRERRQRSEAAWERFLLAEQRALVARAEGILARALGEALPEESQEELERIAREDQRLAQEGIVKLRVGEEILYKHIEELAREDRWARIEAEREEVDWLMNRLRLRTEQSR